VGRSFALILTCTTPIAALEMRPRLRMGYLQDVGGFSVGSLCLMRRKSYVFRDPECCHFAKPGRGRAAV
jgi:hypothetical protein